MAKASADQISIVNYAIDYVYLYSRAGEVRQVTGKAKGEVRFHGTVDSYGETSERPNMS